MTIRDTKMFNKDFLESCDYIFWAWLNIWWIQHKSWKHRRLGLENISYLNIQSQHYPAKIAWKPETLIWKQ